MKKLMLFLTSISYTYIIQTSLHNQHLSRLERMRRNTLTLALEAQAITNTLKAKKQTERNLKRKQFITQICNQLEQELINIDLQRKQLLTKHKALLNAYIPTSSPQYDTIWDQLYQLRTQRAELIEKIKDIPKV